MSCIALSHLAETPRSLQRVHEFYDRLRSERIHGHVFRLEDAQSRQMYSAVLWKMSTYSAVRSLGMGDLGINYRAKENDQNSTASG